MKAVFLLVTNALLVFGCAVKPPEGKTTRLNDPAAVTGITWQWVATVTPVEKISVNTPERYTLLLGADGKAIILFDCNRGGGDYKLGDGTLTFGPLMSTRMACPEDSLDAPFMRDLSRVSSFFVEGGLLYLELPLDSGTMKFRPAPRHR